jgi:hypothetical protein
MRRSTGIDEILRAEGLAGGLVELRAMMRGDLMGAHRFDHVSVPNQTSAVDPYGEAVEYDRFREYPVEGADSYGAIPEDLVAPPVPEPAAAPAPVPPKEPT